MLFACLGSVRPARAQTNERYKPPFDVVFEDGVDISSATKILRLFRKLNGEYPGLVNARIVKKIVFASPARALGNVSYCWNPDGVDAGDAACAMEHAAIVIDLDTVFSFESKYGDFYQKGREMEAVVFHELLHGWAYTHPDRLKEYEKRVSDGRRTKFDRKRHRLFKPLWAIERRMMAARQRVEMGDDTKEQFLAKAESDFDQALRLDRWQRFHDRMSLEEARATLARDEKKMEELGAKIGAKVGNYNRRRNVPRREDTDVHAIENPQEWFAYGGEIAHYAASPEDFLTPDELAWWKSVDGELRTAP
jgi:hypothetical protein